LASERRIPVIFPDISFVEAGGLMSYGPDFQEIHRRTGEIVAKILKGARPADKTSVTTSSRRGCERAGFPLFRRVRAAETARVQPARSVRAHAIWRAEPPAFCQFIP
jgi:hypothetical protein